MKVTNWEVQREEDSVTVVAGPLIDADLQGGLEEVLWREIADGAMHVRIVLGGMRFLHATLMTCLLVVEKHLTVLGGDVTLIDAPWFVRQMLQQLGLTNRFRFGRSDKSGPLYYVTPSEAFRAADEIRHQLNDHLDDLDRFLG